MNFNNKRLSISEAKEIDLVDYLTSLGHEPSKIRNNDYWYLSPLRAENVASFKVNRKINRWYDHGLGKGGNLVDFAVLYHDCTIKELLERLDGSFSPKAAINYKEERKSYPESRIKVVSKQSLFAYPLLRYLQQRHIPIQIAKAYCKEVHYKLNNKSYYGIGFKNDLGGFEIRNPYFKASSSPKGITTINNHTKEAIVFEGFMDFLSFKSIYQNEPANKFDFVILNSVSFFDKARPFMESHQTIRLYLDRDTTGQSYSRHALSLSKKYTDESKLYRNHKDFNDWIMNFGNYQKHHLKHKIRY